MLVVALWVAHLDRLSRSSSLRHLSVLMLLLLLREQVVPEKQESSTSPIDATTRQSNVLALLLLLWLTASHNKGLMTLELRLLDLSWSCSCLGRNC